MICAFTEDMCTYGRYAHIHDMYMYERCASTEDMCTYGRYAHIRKICSYTGSLATIILPYSGADHWPIQLQWSCLGAASNKPFRFEQFSLIHPLQRHLQAHIKSDSQQAQTSPPTGYITRANWICGRKKNTGQHHPNT